MVETLASLTDNGTMPNPRKTSRREFLKGRSAAEELLDLTHGIGNPPPLPVPAHERRDTYLFHLSRAAMACDFEVLFGATEHSDAHESAIAALDLVDVLEDQLSVYREQSEISRLNRQAAVGPVEVEPRLFQLLERAMRLHAATDGAFDITAGPLTKAWGFYRRAGRVPTQGELAEAVSRVGSQWVELDPQTSSVRFLRPGVEINLGAIGKGYALDRCAEWLTSAGLGNYLLHGGMSSVLARGTRAGQDSAGGVTELGPSSQVASNSTVHSPSDVGWKVGVVHPQRPERRLAEVVLRDRALGTSGSGTQFFHHRGKRYGHILDPRTGQPVEGVLSATVLAPTAAEADALATACFVLGVEQSIELCRSRTDLGALLVVPGTHSGSVEIHTAGLTDADWKAL